MRVSNLLGHRFVVDSREVKTGDVFVAIKGARVDGHDFVNQAVQNGAFAVIVERDLHLSNQIIVPNTIEFLGELAGEIINSAHPKIVGLTGSNGKTTTKEILWNVLNAEIPTFKNEGNLNSEIGLPLSIINSYNGEKILVLEMGQRMVGDIEYLCKFFPPDIGILLNVGSAHVGIAGDLESIFKGKWQIVEKSKQALVNYDDERMRKWNCGKCKYFGTNGGDYTLKGKKFNGKSTLINFCTGGENYFYCLPGYWTKVMTLSVLVAFSVCDMLDIIFNPNSLLEFRALKGRFNVHDYQAGYIIDDSYNASYESFKAGIEEVLLNFPRPYYAVVGAMKELGEYSEYYHRQLSELLENFDGIIVLDNEEESRYINTSNLIFRSPSLEEVTNFLSDRVLKPDFSGTVYFKASRAVELERIVYSILDE
ncbi:MAG TPA: UDP-N-acetylmuramoyl-tripeptide--D-alanyl-D-alanine ligase [Fervidobacterium sp.]|nr:UDP-N-acetylmuramoyl-tripeptide--D-alanyl-D-alanine ligase [Fervidobacterium sp.]